MNIERAFGLALKNTRAQKGLSQEQLAEQCGLHRTYISLLERGLKSPSLTTVFRISSSLNLPPHMLVTLTEHELQKLAIEHSNEAC